MALRGGKRGKDIVSVLSRTRLQGLHLCDRCCIQAKLNLNLAGMGERKECVIHDGTHKWLAEEQSGTCSKKTVLPRFSFYSVHSKIK